MTPEEVAQHCPEFVTEIADNDPKTMFIIRRVAQARKERDQYKKALERIGNEGCFSNRNAGVVARSILNEFRQPAASTSTQPST